ncbi:MAG: DUF58 domain-containing protein [Limnochordales bacterium]|nr:DUF58 domain-containing protein [Limnochordales bacterium]
MPLLQPEFLTQLERLRLLTRRRQRGRLPGFRPARGTGTSLEFVDYREYQPGDDLRYVDWHLYARLGRLFLKLFAAEQDLLVTVVLDASASMNFGTPTKIQRARELAAALGFIALSSGDRVRLMVLPPAAAPSPTTLSPVLQGRRQAVHLFRWLEQVVPGGRADLPRAISQLTVLLRSTGGGLVLFLSDLQDPAGPEAFLALLPALTGQTAEAVILHMLSPEELEPDFSGDHLLIDSEMPAARVELALNRRARQLYHQELSLWLHTIRTRAAAAGAEYLLVPTDLPWQSTVFTELVARGRVGR